MPRVLFWNVQRKQLDGHILQLASAEQPDILVLIEFPAPSRVAADLLRDGWARATSSDRFGVFSRAGIRLGLEPNPVGDDWLGFWRATVPGGEDWLIIALHGPDLRNSSQDDTRSLLFRRIVDHARYLERQAGHRRTVILGDFNASPFEPSVMGASGFHAIGVRRVGGRHARAVRRAGRVDFFYNPMWRMYGTDPAADAGAGTYFYRGYEAIEPFWHMLDQVLIRPDFADRLPPDQLRILTTAGPNRLLDTDGLPDTDVASDHLPVTFVLS